MPRVPPDRIRRLLGGWLGETAPVLLGEGMEGAVYAVGDDRVAKVWFAQPAAVDRLRRFYEALGTRPLSFAVPRILDIGDASGCPVTVERRLPGVSLADALRSGGVDPATAHAVLLDVLAELAAAGSVPEARELPVLAGDPPPYDDAADFPQALAALAARRCERFGPVLRAAVGDLDRTLAALPVRLVEVDSGRRSVIHGDLIPANVLVDAAAGRTQAVLDWGFLTTEGDPAFDAAVAAAIFTMYDADALDTELALYDLIEARLGYPRTTLLVYRAAYSLITANAYDPAGTDGHFAWCVRALNRPDVVAALLG